MARYTKEDMLSAVRASKTIKEALEHLNIRAAGGNYKSFVEKSKKWDIDISHFLTFSEVAKRNWESKKFKKVSLEEVLVQNSSYNRGSLKKRLYKEGLKKPICEMEGCGQGEIWLGKKISLILDHINGVWNDNRIENLRIVCPMCNATLPTHAGRNNKIQKNLEKPKILKGRPKERPEIRKVVRPSKEELEKLLWESPTIQIAKTYGVSDKAVEKWAKSYGLSKPPRGFWTKTKN